MKVTHTSCNELNSIVGLMFTVVHFTTTQCFEQPDNQPVKDNKAHLFYMPATAFQDQCCHFNFLKLSNLILGKKKRK